MQKENIFHLFFSPKEKDFSDELKKQNLNSIRIFSPIMGLIFMAFCILDLILAPEFFLKFILIRILYLSFTIMIFWFTYLIRYQYSYILSFLVMIGAGITLSIFSFYYSDQQELIVRSIMAILLIIGLVFPWTPVYTFSTCLLIILSYIFERWVSSESIFSTIDILFLTSSLITATTSNLIVILSKWQDYQNRKALKFSNDRLKELDRLKSNFFANISHEFKTPLNLILSPIESILQGELKGHKDMAKFNNVLKSIQRHSFTLLSLIEDLLNFSKIESGKVPLKIQKINIVHLIQTHMDRIKLSAESRNIQLNFNFPRSDIEIYADMDKFNKVVLNLLSNSLKFTQENGSILVRIDEFKKDLVQIEFQDSGIGIPKNKIHTIFERFSQVDTSTTRQYGGTGIGLSLVKEYVEMHGQKIEIESKYIKDHPDTHGTKLTILASKKISFFENKENIYFIPDSAVDQSYFDPKEYQKDLNLYYEITVKRKPTIKNENISSVKHQVDTYSLLLVENNTDLLEYLKSILEDQYQVYLAVNGEDGLSKARTYHPDIIITDIMMPIMDGNTMAKAIRNDPETCNIPIIFLTARSDISYIIESFQIKAIDYIVKPFNSQELKLRIKNLLDFKQLYTLEETMRQEKSLRKEIEDAHDKLQKLYISREFFFSNLNHEIRTPLNIILIIIERMIQESRTKQKNRKEQKKNIETLHDYVLKITILIDNILELAKYTIGNKGLSIQKLNIYYYLQNFIQKNSNVASAKNIFLSLNFNLSKKKYFYIDEVQFSKTLMNLFHNSLKYIKGKGFIEIKVSQNKENYIIEFADSGTGIQKDVLPHIFKEFFQIDSKVENFLDENMMPASTGLGLAMVEQTIKMHGGSIEVKSKYIDDHPKDHGTIFKIRLPKNKYYSNQINSDAPKTFSSLKIQEQERMQEFLYPKYKSNQKNRSSNQKYRILIVEDDPVMLELFKKIFTEEGYKISIANNGKEGLKMAKNLKPDLVITDLVLPIMDGYKMIYNMNKNKYMNDTPVVIITGKTELNLVEDNMDLIKAKFSKPIHTKYLVHKVNQVIKQKNKVTH